MDGAEDIHICGSCRQEFTQLENFVLHKKTCKSNVKVTTSLPPGGDLVHVHDVPNPPNLDVTMVTEGTPNVVMNPAKEISVYANEASSSLTPITELPMEPKDEGSAGPSLLPLISQIQRQVIRENSPSSQMAMVSEDLESKSHTAVDDVDCGLTTTSSTSLLQISNNQAPQLVNNLNVHLLQNTADSSSVIQGMKVTPESYESTANSARPMFAMMQLEHMADLNKLNADQIAYQVSYHGAVPIQITGDVGSIQSQTHIQGQSFQGNDLSAINPEVVQISQGPQLVTMATRSAAQQEQQPQQQLVGEEEHQQLALQAILSSTSQSTPSKSDSNKGVKSSPKQTPKSSKKGKYTKLITTIREANAKTGAPSIQTLNLEVHTSKEPKSEHSEVKDKPPARYRCSFAGCSYVTQYAKNVDRHMLIHTGLKPHMCEVCNARFSRSDKLREHQRIHTGDKPYKCTVCDYRCGDSSSLKKHNRIHTDERPFRCQICDYASRNSSQLTVHLRTHTGDKPFMCPECSSCFKIKSDLKRHKRLHTGERPFVCDICGVRTAVKSNLLAHKKIYHSEENMISCDQCNFKTSSKRVFKSHQKTHSDPSRVLSCSKCIFVCSDAAALRIHMRMHTDDKQFSCPHCQYFTKTKLCLTRHIKTRHPSSTGKQGKKHGAKGRGLTLEGTSDRTPQRRTPGIAICKEQFKCELCDAGFVRKDSLRSHLRSHKEKDTYNAEKKGAASGSGGIPGPVQTLEVAGPNQQSTAQVHLDPSEQPNYRIQQEHEYAVVLRDTLVKQEVQRSRSSEQSNPAYSQQVVSSAAAGQPEVQSTSGSRQAEHKRIQNLLPYIQNNHNMAMWDNVQNMAISDNHPDDPQGQDHHGLSLNGHGHSSQSSHSQELTVSSNNHHHSNCSSEQKSGDHGDGYVSVETVDYAIAQSISTTSDGYSIPDSSVEPSQQCNISYSKQSSSMELSVQPEVPIPPSAPALLSVEVGGHQSSAASLPLDTKLPESPVTTPAALSSLPQEVQQVIRSLRLPRGTVISVPLMDQVFQIVTDTDPGDVPVVVGNPLAASEQCYHDNQTMTSPVHNNNTNVMKETLHILPSSDPPVVQVVPSGPVTVAQSDPPLLQMAQPLYLLSESTSSNLTNS